MAQPEATNGTEVRTLPSGTVLIAGGGPIGLLLARVLSFYGVRSVLFERNKTTTKWPKMDLTNARSMEMFRKLGLAEDLRRQGVPPHIDQNVLISSGLSTEKPITVWELPGVDKFREQILQNNDGTQPQEPWQRVSQAIFEKWLKGICDEDPLIELYYGHKVESVSEDDDGKVRTTVTETDTGVQTVWHSDYVAGCDGASSRVRSSFEIPLDGGPIPSFALLVHFKSRDLTRLQKQGQFWHIFLLGQSGGFEGAIIAQDEKDTWTTHLFMPLDAEPDKIESHDAVYRVLGGLYEPYEVAIDEILVRSTWRPNIAVTRHWASPSLRVFLAGDSAHQNIPTGGYGMNMGIGDAFDLGWKLASVINGQGGPALLRSYEAERKPVALRNVEHSGVHFQVHGQLQGLMGDVPRLIDQDTEEGRALRQKIHAFYQGHDGENKDIGIEMGYRYTSPVIARSKHDGDEPPFDVRKYIPTTWPGSRAPHLHLSDGTAIFDRFGRDWTLLVFASEEVGQRYFRDSAAELSLPLTIVDLSGEELAKKLYERALVLVRPDHHVAWRAESIDSPEKARRVLEVVTGLVEGTIVEVDPGADRPREAFTSSVGMTTQVGGFSLEKMGEMQK